MSKAATAPESNDSAAIILIAHANPRASAITPAESAPSIGAIASSHRV